MMYQKAKKSPSLNHPTHVTGASRALLPATTQGQHNSHGPPAQEKTKREAFDQNNLNDYWSQRLASAPRRNHDFANIAVHTPGEPVDAPVQWHSSLVLQRNVDDNQIITDAQAVNPTFNRVKQSSLMPIIHAVRHYNVARTQQALDTIRVRIAALSAVKATKYQTALANLTHAVDVEEKRRLRALRVAGNRQLQPEGQTARVVALKNWIETVAQHISRKEFNDAFAMLVNHQGLAAPTAITHIDVKKEAVKGAATPAQAVSIAESNMAFAEQDRIKICFPSDWKWIQSKDATTVQAALLMHLEEYMHIYQARSGEYLSSSTGRFKESDVAPPDMAEDGIIRAQDYDYDETDVMAQMIDWGFDPQEIEYVDRYEGRQEYWKWYQGQQGPAKD